MDKVECTFIRSGNITPFFAFREYWRTEISIVLASHLGRRNLKSSESTYRVILPLRAAFCPRIFVGSCYINEGTAMCCFYVYVWVASIRQRSCLSCEVLQCLKGAPHCKPGDGMQGGEPYPIRSTICYRQWMWQTHPWQVVYLFSSGTLTKGSRKLWLLLCWMFQPALLTDSP